MSPSLEHDYIGGSEVPSVMEACEGLTSPASAVAGVEGAGLYSLEETELRLGLPGSGCPNGREKDEDGAVLTLGLPKGPVAGAKRVFSDAIKGSAAKWAFPLGSGSEVESGKGSSMFSLHGEGGGGSSRKEAPLVSMAAGKETKGQIASGGADRGVAPAAKAQMVGWPPIRSYRKNTMAAHPPKSTDDLECKQGQDCLYVKVSMDGAPYLRKVDLKTYCNYKELSSALEKMFSCFTIRQCGAHGVQGRDGLSDSRLRDLHGSEYVLTYEDKDGDWMLVGDVPWDMFTDSCRRLRIMKGSEAIGIAPWATEKNKGCI